MKNKINKEPFILLVSFFIAIIVEILFFILAIINKNVYILLSGTSILMLIISIYVVFFMPDSIIRKKIKERRQKNGLIFRHKNQQK